MKSWILVADGSSARIYEAIHFKLKLIAHIESMPARLHSHDLGSEKPRGVFELNVPEERVDLHMKEEKNFSYHIAQLLNDAAEKKEFESLTIIAAPKFLGYLRKLLSKKTTNLVQKEVDKDLTHMDEEQIWEEAF